MLPTVLSVDPQHSGHVTHPGKLSTTRVVVGQLGPLSPSAARTRKSLPGPFIDSPGHRHSARLVGAPTPVLSAVDVTSVVQFSHNNVSLMDVNDGHKRHRSTSSVGICLKILFD
ncbi:hypothetical protein J6590_052594 [Homalodisca vitripennis]|nr:hypothetical protein J6590_052594 [Homalodisca vitripennis]